MSIKNSSDTIGNRTRDLATCSAVPQPTAPPRAPEYDGVFHKIMAKNQETHCSLRKHNGDLGLKLNLEEYYTKVTSLVLVHGVSTV